MRGDGASELEKRIPSKNGIFTYLVLRSLGNTEGDENTNRNIDVRELRKIVKLEASRMTGGLQNLSTRRLDFIIPFVISEQIEPVVQ